VRSSPFGPRSSPLFQKMHELRLSVQPMPLKSNLRAGIKSSGSLLRASPSSLRLFHYMTGSIIEMAFTYARERLISVLAAFASASVVHSKALVFQ
jgi:hypothetical protein